MFLKIFRTSFYATAFVPLLVWGGFAYPAVTTKVLGFVFLTILMLFSWAFFYRKKKLSVTLTPLLVLPIIFFIILCVTAVFGVDPVTSFWSDVERMEGIYLWAYLLLFFVLSSSVIQKDEWFLWLRSSFFVGVFVSLYAVFQFMPSLTKATRVDSFFDNPMFLGQYLLLTLFVGVLSILGEERRRNIYLYGSALLVIVLAILFTGTRGALLGLLAGLAVFAVLMIVRTDLQRSVRIGVLGMLGVCIVFVALLTTTNVASTLLGQTSLSRFSNISISDIKENPRYYIWEAGVDGIIERPFFGWGIEQFGTVSDRYTEPIIYDESIFRQPELWNDRAHNIFIGYGVSGGVPLLFVFLALLSVLVYGAFLRSDLRAGELPAIAGFVAAYAVSGFFGFDTVATLLLLFGVLGYVHASWKGKWSATFQLLRVRPTFLPVIMYAALSIGLVSMVVLYLRFNHAYVLGLLQTETTQTSRERFDTLSEHADSMLVPGDTTFTLDELAIAGNALLLSGTVYTTSDIDALVETFSRHLGTEVHRRDPSAKELFFSGVFMRLAGQSSKAIDLLSKAVLLAPERVHILNELGRAYLENNDLIQAKELLERSYALAPSHAGTVKLYIAFLIRSGKGLEAISLLQKTFGGYLVYDPDILLALLSKGSYDSVKVTLEERLKQDTKDLYALTLLMYTYHAMGNENRVLSVLEDGYDAFPDRKKYFDYMLVKIKEDSYRPESIRVAR